LLTVRCLAKAGRRREALVLLGEALHPVMDSTSSLPTDPNGYPRVWKPYEHFGDSFNEHVGYGTIQDITPLDFMIEDQVIQSAYFQVFGD